MLSPRIETERLILRRYEENDIDMQYQTLIDERLHQYIKFPNLTREEELKCIKEWISNADIDKHEKWVITLKEENIAIGNISVNDINKKNNYCNVGYVILYDFWGNGYAAEALEAVSKHLLNDSGYYLVECSCNELNKQSSKVMLKAGFVKDGYIANRRKNLDGTYSGVEYYSKTK
jgi:ribosomal-protein-alanine N-acetyltransferase